MSQSSREHDQAHALAAQAVVELREIDSKARLIEKIERWRTEDDGVVEPR